MFMQAFTGSILKYCYPGRSSIGHDRCVIIIPGRVLCAAPGPTCITYQCETFIVLWMVASFKNIL